MNCVLSVERSSKQTKAYWFTRKVKMSYSEGQTKSNQLCKCGCGERTNIVKMTNSEVVAGEPYDYILGHHLRKPKKYKVDPKTGCWIWQLYTNEDGYGVMWYAEADCAEKSHIVYYERAKGPVPEGKELHHTCENRLCVNPEHLEPLTKPEHIRIHSAVLDISQVRDIRKLNSKGMSSRKLSTLFEISRGAIQGILKNRTWKGVI